MNKQNKFNNLVLITTPDAAAVNESYPFFTKDELVGKNDSAKVKNFSSLALKAIIGLAKSNPEELADLYNLDTGETFEHTPHERGFLTEVRKMVKCRLFSWDLVSNLPEECTAKFGFVSAKGTFIYCGSSHPV